MLPGHSPCSRPETVGVAVLSRADRIRIRAAVAALAFLAPVASAQGFSHAVVWDTIPIDTTPGEGPFGKASVLRMSAETIADVLVRRGTRIHLLIEPGCSQQSLAVPTVGEVRDFAVFPGGGTPDAFVTATTAEVSFWRMDGAGLAPEAFPISVPPIERVALGPKPHSSDQTALALWAPSQSKIHLFALHWNPATWATEVTHTYPPRAFTQLEALAVVDFNGDTVPDIAAAYPGGLRVFSFEGTVLKSVAKPGQTIALVPFRAPGTTRDGLAWLRQSSGNTTLEAVAADYFDALPLTGTFVGATAFGGGSGQGPRLVLSRSHGEVQLVNVGTLGVGPILGLDPEQQAILNQSDGWAVEHDFDRDSCDDFADLLVFDESLSTAELYRRVPEVLAPGMSISSVSSWAHLYPPDPIGDVKLSVQVTLDSQLAVAEVQVRAWEWPDFHFFQAGPPLGSMKVVASPQATTLQDIDLGPPPAPEDVPDGLLVEIRALGADSQTLKIICAVLRDLNLELLPVPQPPTDPCPKVTTVGDPRGVVPLPSKPPGH